MRHRWQRLGTAGRVAVVAIAMPVIWLIFFGLAAWLADVVNAAR